MSRIFDKLMTMCAQKNVPLEVYMKNGFCMHGYVIDYDNQYLYLDSIDSKKTNKVEIINLDAISTIEVDKVAADLKSVLQSEFIYRGPAERKSDQR